MAVVEVTLDISEADTGLGAGDKRKKHDIGRLRCHVIFV